VRADTLFDWQSALHAIPERRPRVSHWAEHRGGRRAPRSADARPRATLGRASGESTRRPSLCLTCLDLDASSRSDLAKRSVAAGPRASWLIKPNMRRTLLAIALALALASHAWACTSMLASPGASADGSSFVTYNSGTGLLLSPPFVFRSRLNVLNFYASFFFPFLLFPLQMTMIITAFCSTFPRPAAFLPAQCERSTMSTRAPTWAKSPRPRRLLMSCIMPTSLASRSASRRLAASAFCPRRIMVCVCFLVPAVLLYISPEAFITSSVFRLMV
jgi:hypothetical protein